jgi:hypothetical protein
MSETLEPRPELPAEPVGPTAPPTNPTVAYERTDVDTRAVIWFVTALTVFLAVMMVGLIGLHAVFVDRESQEKKPQYPIAASARERLAQSDPDRLLPPSPRLEGIAPRSPGQPPGRVRALNDREEHDVGRMRPGTAAALNQKQERLLTETWQWVDESHAAARIPITEAMSRLLAKPNSVLKARAPDKRGSGAIELPTRSNSGRPPGEGTK